MNVRRTRAAGAAALLATLLVSGPAVGSPLGPAGARPQSVDAALSVANEAREAMESGRLADVLRVAGIPTPGEIAPGPGMVDGVPAPIAGLDAVIRLAGDRIKDSLPSGFEERSLRTLMLRAMTGEHIAPLGLGPSVENAIREAAGPVAAAIDELLPQILALPSTGSAGTSVQGCDLHDDAPDLCVASDADNVLSKDYALVVDLGGDDTHTHAAGGASIFDNHVPVSVTIDAEGADVYDAPIPTASGSYIAQGASFFGAGFLIDAAGDDEYRIVTNGPLGGSLGQGKAWWGVGMLADLQGADTYELSATGPGPQDASGQGEAINGVGVLLDPAGDDVHSIRSTSTDYFDGTIGSWIVVEAPEARAIGMGVATYEIELIPIWVGPHHVDSVPKPFENHGLFLDGGGTDVLEVRSEVLDPMKDAYFGRRWIYTPEAYSVGIGAGAGPGYGTVVLGDGATDATIESISRSPRTNVRSLGLGYATNGTSHGVVADAGGDDVWRMSAENVVERRGSLSPGCSCPPPARAQTGDTTLRGQGYGVSSSSLGLIEDASGDDEFIAHVTTSVDTELVVQPGDPADEVRATSTAGAVRVAVQGAAEGFGTGEIHDSGGDDRYEIIVTGATRSKLSGVPSENGHAASVGGNTSVLGQSAARDFGAAVLRDTGGSDTYTISSTNAAEAEPPSNVQPGTMLAGVLASVDEGSTALFFDADGGELDQISMSPGTPACTGTRGQGQWVDCGGAGVGVIA